MIRKRVELSFHGKHSFPVDVLRNVVQDINDNDKAFGTLAPLDGETIVRISEFSHRILLAELTKDGKVIVEIETLDTGPGRYLEKLMKDNLVEFGFLGVGSLHDDGTVRNDYKLRQIAWFPREYN